MVLRPGTSQYLLEEDDAVLTNLVLAEDINTGGNPKRNIIHSFCCQQELLCCL